MTGDLRVRGAVEAILFAADRPVTIGQIASLLRAAGFGPVSEDEVLQTVEHLAADCEAPGRGVRVEFLDGDGWRMVRRPEYRTFVVEAPLRLSRAAWETLAVIAHLQPVTSADVAAVRNCGDVSGVLETLLATDLICVAERRRAAGRPRVYRTTKEFLRRFGLRDLGELPPIGQLRGALIAN